MKTVSITLCSAALFFAACATDTPTSADSRNTPRRGDAEPSKHRPQLGMTKAQVRAAYGEPDSTTHTPKGEVWEYWFNRASSVWIGSKPRVAGFLFGADGKLKDYIWNE